MSLCDFADELVESLNTVKENLTKTIYIHYAQERDKNEQLQQENARLKNKIKTAFEYVDDKLTNLNLEYGVDNEFREEYDELWEILKEN
jgi:hypothetical protein